MSDDVRARRKAARVVPAEAQAVCPVSIAEKYAVDYLRRAQAGQEEADIRVPMSIDRTI
jgi:hypothetical protein